MTAAIRRAFGDASLSADGRSAWRSRAVPPEGCSSSTPPTARRSGPPTSSRPMSWSIPAHTASVLFDTDNTLWVGVPDGEVMTIDPTGAADGQLDVLTTFAGSKWSTEYGLRLGESDDGDRYLITFGSGAVSRIDLQPGRPRGRTRVVRRTCPSNRTSESRAPASFRAGTSWCPRRRNICTAPTTSGRCSNRKFRPGRGRRDSSTDRTGVTGPLALTLDQKRTPGIELQRRGGGTVEARRERPDPACDRLRRRLGRNVRVQLDGVAVDFVGGSSTIRRSGIRSRER